MSVCVSPLVQATTLMTDESLSCPQCPKSFSSTKLLQQHQQMFHTDKAFICETCGKAFRFRSNLAEHRSVHTALKPYVCKFCGKSSRLKGNLTKHILKHHKKEQNEAIAKDDIIVKKTPKIIKENGTTTNGTTTTTSTPTTATSVITATSPGSNNVNHNNNNNNSVVNNNHRAIKMEIEDPEYISMAVPKAPAAPVVAKIVTPNLTATPRARPQPKENGTVITTITTPAIVIPSPPEDLGFLPKDITTDSESFELFRSVMISLGLDFGNSLPLSTKEMLALAQELKKESSSSPDSQSHLQIHMTTAHGHPPPGEAEEEKPFIRNGVNVEKELRGIAVSIAELREAQRRTPKVDDRALKNIDARVGKLEKSLETALNSIYTLVQLQSGMTSSVNRLREDSARHFADLKSQMNVSYSPQRISRRNSIRSESVSRDRSRSPL
uniref:C2H2-type domain-containing protein n=2 Tax=Caenorhabditis tropicalis TaxID=1561998 RepID=A0A1I7T882_9PELO